MPYHIDKNNCVKKSDTGETVKCHKTHAQALAHLRALEANVPDANKELIAKAAMDDCMKQHMADLKKNKPDMSEADMTAAAREACKQSKALETKNMGAMMLMQSEVNYGAANGQVGKACSVCRWFCPAGDMEEAHCHLVMDYPAPITPNGLCDRWEAVPTMSSEPAPIPVTIVEPDDSMEMALPTNRKGFIELITDTVKNILLTDTVKNILRPEPTPEPAFQVLKANGKSYWLARHTGKFKDREGEIIADKAHEEYVARVQKGLVPLPELWVWHTKGTRHGQADLVWKSGGFLLAFGHFDDTVEAQRAVGFYEKNAGKIKLSHMFNFPRSAKLNGVYYAYNTIEITTLPDGAEAFPYTSFEEFKPMALTKEQREFIKGVGGDDMLKRVESADAKAADDTKALEANGVESKGLDNFEGATIPAATGDIEALKVVQTDMDTRLKAVESLPEQLKTLASTIKALTDQVAASQAAESAALEKVNALEAKVLEYSALKPPASQAKDTLLAEREKSLLDTLMVQTKAEHTPSLVDTLVGGQPAVTTGERL